MTYTKFALSRSSSLSLSKTERSYLSRSNSLRLQSFPPLTRNPALPDPEMEPEPEPERSAASSDKSTNERTAFECPPKSTPEVMAVTIGAGRELPSEVNVLDALDGSLNGEDEDDEEDNGEGDGDAFACRARTSAAIAAAGLESD